MEKNYVINLNEESKEIKNYYAYIYGKKKVKEFIENYFNEAFFTFDIDSYPYEHIRNEQIDGSNPNLKIISLLMDGTEDYILRDRKEENESLYKKPSNSIYYDEKFRIAIAVVPEFNNASYVNSDYILYARTEQEALAYVKHVNAERKKKRPNEITMFTDSRDGLKHEIEKISKTVTRDEVVLDKKLKDDIYNSIDGFFKENENFYKKYNIPHKRGVLLYGEPGNGKTTLIKSIVSSVEYPVAYWQVNEYTTSESVEKVFNQVAQLAPVVLVIEDIDSLPAHTRSTFLNTLDGATTKDGFFLIGTTNYPERLDSALKNRAGRFDRTYEIKLPNSELRKEFLTKRGTLDFVSQVMLDEMVEKTKGFSYVQLNEVFISIAFQSYNNEEIDPFSVIELIEKNNRKNAKNDWVESESKKSMGFQN